MVADNNKPVVNESGDAVENITPEVEDEPQLTNEEKIEEIDKLMKKGNRAYILKDFETATDNFSMATEYSVSVYGEFAPETFESHFQYGRSLIEMVFLENESAQNQLEGIQEYLSKKMDERKQKLGIAQPDLDDSVVGNPEDVPEEEKKEVIEAVDKALEENAEELDALAEAKEAEKSSENEKEEKDESKPNDIEMENKEEKSKETENAEEVTNNGEAVNKEETEADDEEMKTAEEEGESENDDEDDPEPTSAELAWEVLEVARKICEKQESNKEWDLRKSEVLHYIGQLSIVEEKFENAIESILGSVELRKKHFPEHDRTTASYLFEVAEAWKLHNNFVRAAEFYRQAENALNTFVTETEKTIATLSEDETKKAKEEIEEVQKMLPEIANLIVDAEESAKARELQKTEMAKMESPEKVKTSEDENEEPITEMTNFRKKRPATEESPDTAKKPKIDETTEKNIPVESA